MLEGGDAPLEIHREPGFDFRGNIFLGANFLSTNTGYRAFSRVAAATAKTDAHRH